MFPDTTLQGKRKDGLGLAISFLNISINLTYFNIFCASVHMLYPQDGWSCHSIEQTDELKPKQYFSLPLDKQKIWNWNKSAFAYQVQTLHIHLAGPHMLFEHNFIYKWMYTSFYKCTSIGKAAWQRYAIPEGPERGCQIQYDKSTSSWRRAS